MRIWEKTTTDFHGIQLPIVSGMYILIDFSMLVESAFTV